jgi:PadR family transcriptional regulator, regulatory protein PadR
MNKDIRLSGPALALLRVLLERPREGKSGADIARATKVGSGTLYPLLARLERAGWLSSEWETVDPAAVGRPRRRFYKLTGFGQRRALEAFAAFQLDQVSEGLAWSS